jgi:Cys-rich peptide (TIGR04165 family)
MKIDELKEKCPKCGCQDKTIERKIRDEHLAFATTGVIKCSKCGYVFSSPKDRNKEE